MISLSKSMRHLPVLERSTFEVTSEGQSHSSPGLSARAACSAPAATRSKFFDFCAGWAARLPGWSSLRLVEMSEWTSMAAYDLPVLFVPVNIVSGRSDMAAFLFGPKSLISTSE